MVGERQQMTSTPIANKAHDRRDDVIRCNDNGTSSQSIVDFKEKNESSDKMDANRNQKNILDANPKITISSGDNNQVIENLQKKPDVGIPISNDIKIGSSDIIKSNELLAGTRERERTSSDADDVDMCDVDFTSSKVQLAEQLGKSSDDVSVVELIRGDKGLGLGLIDGLVI